MKTVECDVGVIGGGPAGLSAALAAEETGAQKVVIVERDCELGGILQQCIHSGFGLQVFKEELTGPEYAGRLIEAIHRGRAREGADAGLGQPYGGKESQVEGAIDVLLNTTVLELSTDRRILAVNPTDGLLTIKAKAVVLAMGCREKSRGAIAIPGTRPAGVYTAGTAQRFVNIEGLMPGREVVILGSGDVGLIMARRLTLEGAKVKAVLELMPYPGGLARNIVQCLEDFGIPLLLSHTVVQVHGKERVQGVTCAIVDENKKPIPGTEKFISCDTLLLSIGLIPENEISRAAGVTIDEVTGGPVVNELMETSVPGVFACGNVVHVHDLADNVTREARVAGRAAALFASGALQGFSSSRRLRILPGRGIRYVVPHSVVLSPSDGIGRKTVPLFMRVKQPEHDVIVEIKFRTSSGGAEHTVSRHKYVAVRPGEMLEILLDLEHLAKIIGQRDGEVEVGLASQASTVSHDSSVSVPAPESADVIRKLTCVICPSGCEILVKRAREKLEVSPERDREHTKADEPAIEGFRCLRGKSYAEEEVSAPRRTLTTTVRVTGGVRRLVPVRTRDPIPKGLIPECMKKLNSLELNAPVIAGQIVVQDLLGTGVDVVTTDRVDARGSSTP